jgi:TonB family protein
MIAHWMLYSLTVGALLCLGAAALEAGCRALRLPARGAWFAGLSLMLVVPAAMAWRSAADGPADAPPPLVLTVAEPRIGAAEPGRVSSLGRTIDLAALDRPLAAAWLGTSAAAAAAMLAMAVALAARRRRWRRAEVDGVPVLVSDDTGPAVVGFVRTAIVLPRWAEEAEPRARGLMLEHERQHLRAWDPQLLALGMAAVALVPWSPAGWWMLRRLRLAVEVDCDARVLARGGDVRAYGALLLEVGRRGGRRGLAAAAFSQPARSLERRLRMMTTPVPRRPGLAFAAFLAIVLLGGTAIAAVPAPAVPPWPAAAADAATPAGPIPSPDPAAVDTVVPRLANARQVARALQAVYPPLLRDAGVPGEVRVRLRVAATGGVGDAEVVETTHEAFAAPALEAIRLARFEPARVQGRPVDWTLEFPVRFAPLAAAAPPAAASPPGLPEIARRDRDRPPVLTNAQEVARAIQNAYPPLLRDAGVTGTAWLAVSIAATGEVVDARALSATHDSFGAAAERALRGARFRPAEREGRPVAVEVTIPVLFTLAQAEDAP